MREFINIPKIKRILKVISVTFLVAIVWVTVSSTSYRGQLQELIIVSVLFLVGWAIGMHVLFIIINFLATVVLRLPKDQQKFIIILASQKTLGVGVSLLPFLLDALGMCIIF